MTVLQVCAFAAEYPGNFIATLTALGRTLEEKGIQTIYAFPRRAREKAWCQELCNRTTVYFLPEANARILPETYRTFRQIYAKHDVAIVHSHFELYDMPATLTAPKQTKVYWHLHDPIGEDFDKLDLMRRILAKLQYGWVGKRATLLTVSQKHGDFAVSIGFPKEQVIYHPNGINTEKIRHVDTEMAKPKKQFLLLGWDVYRKGVDVLTVAAAALRRTDCRFRVVGLDQCEEYLIHHATQGIQFLRPVTDINMLFQDTSCFLHISRAEGQSYALLEAIYAGLPVICSDIPENLFAQQFQNIFWVKTGNAKDLTDMLRWVLDEAPLPTGEDIAQNREIIDKNYSIQAWVEQTVLRYFPNGL